MLAGGSGGEASLAWPRQGSLSGAGGMDMPEGSRGGQRFRRAQSVPARDSVSEVPLRAPPPADSWPVTLQYRADLRDALENVCIDVCVCAMYPLAGVQGKSSPQVCVRQLRSGPVSREAWRLSE